jgi:hypothetical protein
MFDVDSINKDKTCKGVWGEYLGGEFLVAHTSNLDFQREFNRLQAPHRKKIDKGKLDPKIQAELLCKAIGRHLLLDWKNVGSKGNELEFDTDVAINVLMNNEDLRDFIQEFSMDIDNFRDEGLDSSGKS